jgi:two-component system sensor histidine kinase RstB
MTRLFLKIAIAVSLILFLGRLVFFVLLDRQLFSDRERIVAGLPLLHLGSLRLAAAELRLVMPQDRRQRLQEWNLHAASRIRLIQMSELSETHREQLQDPDGFVDEYEAGILSRLTVAVDTGSCLQLESLNDHTLRFIEEEVQMRMSPLLARIADGRLTPSDLPRVSETLGLPLRLRFRNELPADAGQPAAGSEDVVLFHEGRESYAAMAMSNSEQVLCVGPLVRIRARAEWISFVVIATAASCAVIVTGGFVILLAGRFRRIESAAMRIAAGDFSVRVKETATGEAAHLATAFNRMAATTENAIRTHRDLLNVISHELRSPVARLRFAVEMLEGPELNSADSRLSVIRHSLDDLEKITIEALQYVELDGRPKTLAREWIDVREAVLCALNAIQLESAGLNIRFCDDGTETDLRVFADLRGFHRVLTNLIGNAQRFAKSELTVRVARGIGRSATRSRTAGLFVIVDDDGPGIAEHRRKMVLEPFVRDEPPIGESPRPSEPKYAHIGLGLAIAKGILDQHKGTLEIQSNHSGGCRVVSWWRDPDPE